MRIKMRSPIGARFGFRTLSWGLCVVGLGITIAAAQETQPATSPSIERDSQISNRVAIITIEGMIDDVTYTSIKRRAELAMLEGVDIIVFELDTPGGMVNSAVDIAKYIRELSENEGIKTVAWVHHEAISGGTMVSMACDEIIMSRGSLLGDCGVIMMQPGGGAQTIQDPGLDAKIESYVLAVFDSASTREGYDPLLCESFVRYEIEVWWLENTETGERKFVTGKQKSELLNFSIFQNTEEEQPSQWKLVETFVDPMDNEEKPLRQPVVPSDKLLTIDQSMATALGFCKGLVRDVRELRAFYHVPENWEIPRLDRLWSENLVSWLTSPIVRGILLAVIGLGAYTELKTPGLGLPGLIAVVALALFLGAPYMTGLANVWEIVIVIVGILLLMAEVFVIPGFGIAGISGMALVMVGLLATFMPEEPTQPWPIYWPEMPQSFEGLKVGVIVLASGMLAIFAGIATLARYLPDIPVFRKLIPPNPTAEQVTVEDVYHGAALPGDAGIAITTLRPSGKARFGSTLVDVVSDGGYIETGQNVVVVDRRGNVVIVREVV